VSPVSRDRAYCGLKRYLIASTGLAFYEDWDERLTTLICGRLAVLGMPGCACYAEFLADGDADPAEMDIYETG
jgi:hypothetical protein